MGFYAGKKKHNIWNSYLKYGWNIRSNLKLLYSYPEYFWSFPVRLSIHIQEKKIILSKPSLYSSLFSKPDLTLTYVKICRWCVIELYTWDLCGLSYQCHSPTSAIKKQAVTKNQNKQKNPEWHSPIPFPMLPNLYISI